MESALNIVTGEIIDAAQLQYLSAVERGRFVCHGCGVRLLPASYRPSNLVNPYFTVGSTGRHLENCDVIAGHPVVSYNGEKRSGSDRDEIPALFPTRLHLKKRTNGVLNPNSAALSTVPELKAPSDSSLKRPCGGLLRSRTVNTIRQICHTFVHYPQDRDLPLHIPGVNATRYYTVFKKLKWDELQRYQEPRIFYAALRWTKPIEDDGSMQIALDVGARDEGHLVAGHILKISWAEWLDARKACVRREIVHAQLCARHAYKAGRAGVKAYVFFLGLQETADPRFFCVDDYRLLCCFVGKISYPKF